ncbi:MAG TPA: hypothetical protein VFV47_13010, partial [Hyphomicrobiaceae bacterium]|nr:hypothetical protein [Hyphomicrobiaceae bacterium]
SGVGCQAICPISIVLPSVFSVCLPWRCFVFRKVYALPSKGARSRKTAHAENRIVSEFAATLWTFRRY